MKSKILIGIMAVLVLVVSVGVVFGQTGNQNMQTSDGGTTAAQQVYQPAATPPTPNMFATGNGNYLISSC